MQRAVAARAQRQRPPDDLFLGDSNRINPRALRVHDGTSNPLGLHRPGPRYITTGDPISDAAIGFNDATEQAYEERHCYDTNAWRGTRDEQQSLSFQVPGGPSPNQVQGQGEFCTLDDGSRGITVMKGGKLVCAPIGSRDHAAFIDSVYDARAREDAEAWKKPPPSMAPNPPWAGYRPSKGNTDPGQRDGVADAYREYNSYMENAWRAKG